jgi:HEPN domain-containing protein
MSDAVTAIKTGFIKESFIRAADHNYLLGRHGLRHGLVTDGMWLVAHAVEKYLKATLLLNGRGVKTHSHDIASLFDEALQIAGDYIPGNFMRIRGGVFVEWTKQITIREYISRLNSLGAPENRYQLLGYNFTTGDVLLTDQLIYWLRRTSRTLGKVENLSDPKFWEIDPYLPLERIFHGSDRALAGMLLEGNLIWNWIMSGGKVRRVSTKTSLSIQTSALDILLDDLKALPADQRSASADKLLHWMCKNVRMSKATEAALKQAVRTITSRSSEAT